MILDQLNVLAIQDVTELWRRSSDLDSEAFRALIIEAFPELVDPYAAAAAELGAVWYDDSAPELDYIAKPAALPAAEMLSSSAEWALGASGDLALGRLAGAAQRSVWNANRRTIVENSRTEAGARWARAVSGDACAFCAMLSTRGAAYRSESTADFRSHDHCRCQAKEVRPGQTFTPAAHVARYEDAYRKASESATGTDAILAEMRLILGSH